MNVNLIKSVYSELKSASLLLHEPQKTLTDLVLQVGPQIFINPLGFSRERIFDPVFDCEQPEQVHVLLVLAVIFHVVPTADPPGEILLAIVEVVALFCFVDDP